MSLDEKMRAAWPYAFDLVYSVTLERTGLTTSLVVNNKEQERSFEIQALFHSYFRCQVRFSSSRFTVLSSTLCQSTKADL